MIENIHLKSVLAFYLAHGGMFRAQEHLLIPSELRDTTLQSRLGGQIPTNFNGILLYETQGFL